MAIIYCITKNINQKKYVGKTIHTLQFRWQQHVRAARKDKVVHRPLYAAIRKYGIQNFTYAHLIPPEPQQNMLHKKQEVCMVKLHTLSMYVMVNVKRHTAINDVFIRVSRKIGNPT